VGIQGDAQKRQLLQYWVRRSGTTGEQHTWQEFYVGSEPVLKFEEAMIA
jgi:hypothetical protein